MSHSIYIGSEFWSASVAYLNIPIKKPFQDMTTSMLLYSQSPLAMSSILSVPAQGWGLLYRHTIKLGPSRFIDSGTRGPCIHWQD